MSSARPATPLWWGPRMRIFAAFLIAGLFAAWTLGLDFDSLLPSEAGRNKALDFFAKALSPATTYETTPPPGTEPLLWKVFRSMLTTVGFAAAAVSLAVVAGFMLATFASTAMWEFEPVRGDRRWHRFRKNFMGRVSWSLVRIVMATLRSVHELLWAILLLRAFGLNPLTGVLAIALPYTGTFAKAFAEILDESPRETALALQALGARRSVVIGVGFLPRSLPDMASYVLYQLECGIRSSAVMGFFGIPTLGYYLKPAFEEQHYAEVWTYLYGLLILVLVVGWWSHAIRKRIATA